MSTGTEWSDDELLAALGEAVADADAVTDRSREAARAAFTWRTVDTELFELLHDSALDPGAAVRAGGRRIRTLSFVSGRVGLEVEVEGEQVRGQVVGDIVPTVVLQRTDAPDRTVHVGPMGFFKISDVPSGPVRFVARAAQWSLTSRWIVL
jgi:hypothetical protein